MEASINDLMLERWLRKRNSGELVWKTKNGDQIPIKSMSDSHLENAIRFIERNEEMRETVIENYCEHEDAGDR